MGEKTADWGWTNPDYKDFKGNTPSWLKPSETFYGDDWNDYPYEHNAGKVYDEFINCCRPLEKYKKDVPDYIMEDLKKNN